MTQNPTINSNHITSISLVADLQTMLVERGVIDQKAIDDAGGIALCLLPVISHLIDEAERMDAVRCAVGGDA